MDLFKYRGIHCVVDGQYGSTGKGALSAYLAEQSIECGRHFEGAIYSGGPNSGHTFFHNGDRHVVKQLPAFAAYLALRGKVSSAYLSAGAVIDRDVLKEEANRYPDLHVFVHPNAAIVTDEDKKAEEYGSIAEVAGTRSGTGEALVRKVRREFSAIANNSLGMLASNVVIQNHRLKPERNAYFMEVAQGFSLGINSQFYPKVTSRECTVMQGLSDARIAPSHLSRTYMAIRTFPIRVGNVDGHSSGSWYSDQHEVTWDKIGVEPELTTVTKRVRRVATFSMDQFYDACYANDPDVVFLSHMDYMNRERQLALLDDINQARGSMNKNFTLMASYGPTVNDVRKEDELYEQR